MSFDNVVNLAAITIADLESPMMDLTSKEIAKTEVINPMSMHKPDYVSNLWISPSN